ncbi:MAG: biotin-dependent carboxyltransferase family protein [Candidatus Caldatribacteriota bacterium]|nr:biotin-dependent carboxyltransferase family protein [Candidatus Caldatribacteriota bacterium]
MEGFKIIQSGIFDTIQDLGRYGFQQYGMPVSGAMDSCALQIGNRLLGNKKNEAGIEITTPGLSLKAISKTAIVVTGADFVLKVNDISAPMWEVLEIKEGDIISFNQIKSGCRAYLSIAGGIDVPCVLGSKSTYVRAKIGGLEGRPLKKSDIINIGNPEQKLQDIIGRKIESIDIPDYPVEKEIRVILGPQDNYFTKAGLSTFLNSFYEITVDSDRMGYRLKGLKIETKNGSDIITDGIPLGSIQVPQDGMPIVMLADRQTTGGYAKIATVVSVDIDKFAQMKPGNKVKFTKINLEEAHQLLQEREEKITNLHFEKKEFVELKLGNKRMFKVKINEKKYKVEIEKL